MKAEISRSGILLLTAESQTDEYALVKLFTEKPVLDKYIGVTNVLGMPEYD